MKIPACPLFCAGYRQQGKLKSGTMSLDGVHIEHRTMGLHDLPHQRESQPRAAITPRRRTVQLMEWLEDIVNMTGRDADTRIGDSDEHQILALAFDIDRHASAR